MWLDSSRLACRAARVVARFVARSSAPLASSTALAMDMRGF